MIRSQRAVAYELEHRSIKIQTLARRLDDALPDWDTWRRRIDDLGRVAHGSLASRMTLTRVEVSGMARRLDALDPAAILCRGFSLVQRLSDDKVVTSSAQVANGDALTITVSDGVIPATASIISRACSPSKKSKTSARMPEMERLL